MKIADTFPDYPLDYLLGETVDFLEDQGQYFRSRDLTLIHYKSTVLLSKVLEGLWDKRVSYKQAQYTFLKWISIISVRAPKYLVAINASFNDNNFEVNKVKYLLQDIIIDCGFLEIAYEAIDRGSSINIQESSDIAREYTNIRQQYGQGKRPEGNKRSFNHNFSDKQIDILYDQLILSAFIAPDTEKDNFQELFSSNVTMLRNPISWIASTVLLAYMFHKLDTRYELISGKWQTHFGDKRKAFISKKGVTISASSLSTYVSSIVGEEHPERIALYHKQITPVLEAIKAVKI